jgi:type II secretory pathway pseudopilin PulG
MIRFDDSMHCPARHRAFTLLEMLTTVAVLIIVLGLMVSLARYVRNHSATQLTRDVLAHLDEAMIRYMRRNSPTSGPASEAPTNTPITGAAVAGAVPPVRSLARDGTLPSDERQLLAAAAENNRQFVAALRSELLGNYWSGLPSSVYDNQMLRDAWGTPIVFMPAKHNEIGMAPQDRPFFFSAGPDRQYRSRADNLYSYEQGPPR